ncbi:MAG: hypothetical protein U1E05_14145, partial [Patescibacteria group bacterium]|nr:hypothetical protein [Patescibacteria group bacterium]
VDEVLVCAARRPNLAGLALETAAVRYGECGIACDDWLRTSDGRVYAAGGACGHGLASPEAEEGTGRLAAYNASAWRPRRLSASVIPRYTPTDPPVVQLRPWGDGATAEAATERGIEFRDPSGTWGDAGTGCISVRLDGWGRLTGATLAGAEAESLALPLMLLMARRLPLTHLHQVTACHSVPGNLLLTLAR